MKKFDIVKLINEQSCKKYGLNNDMHGIFVEENLNMLKILFFNPKSTGDYILRDIEKQDIQIDDEKLPKEIQNVF